MMPAQEIRVEPGFCLQATSNGDKLAGRWYVNFCRHRLIEMPVAASGMMVSRDHILKHGIGNVQVPFDVGSLRKLKARAEGAKQTTYCVDVVFNPFIVNLFMEDAFCHAKEEYRPWVVGLAFNSLKRGLGVDLDKQSAKLVKTLAYKDGGGLDGNIPHPFTDLPDDAASAFTAEMPRMESPPAPEAESTQLISEVESRPRQRAVKKGFLNKKDAAPLYGPEGSKEGVVPENAGDPMGWMPKKLRQNSKIIDCNSPEYQKQEQAKRSSEEANEWRSEMTKDLDKWAKRASPNKWSADLPLGSEPQRSSKYDVDYARFEEIPDVEEALPGGDRDWYYDHSGQRQPLLKRGAAQHPTGANVPTQNPAASEATAPAVKKGFLEGAKGSIYPEGSAECPVAPPDQAKLLREFGSMLSDAKRGGASLDGLDGLDGVVEDFGRMMSENEASAGAADGDGPAAAKASTAVKATERKQAEFTLDREGDAFRLAVALPGQDSMKGVNLDVTAKKVVMDFPLAMRLRPLQVELPQEVQASATRAKFSKKKQKLVVTLPFGAGSPARAG